MGGSEEGQVSRSPAEVYEERFVPALLQEWADQVADAAGLRQDQRVLDVACGTGVLARAAVKRVGPGGSVVGIDPNQDMLAVARRKAPNIEWREGRAEALPFESASFDAVVSQFGLMFFQDRRAAVQEMMRVLRPGGRMTVAVWDKLENTPGYAALTEVLRRLFGDQIADTMRAPNVLGDREVLRSVFTDAGIPDAEITTRAGRVRFASIHALISAERACAWTLGGLLNDAQFELLYKEAEPILRPFVADDGSVTFAAPAHIVRVTKT